MIVTFLGTGNSQGIPVIACQCAVCQSMDYRDKRLRTSVHIAVNNKSFVIDTGPDFRQQMLLAKINTLDAVLFTHEHKDHTAGMDDIRGFNFKQKKKIPICARKQVLNQLKQEFSYIFSENQYPGAPQISVREIISNQPFEIEGVQITPIDTQHYKLPVFGFQIEDFVYITDTNFIRDTELDKIRNAKVLVINALHQSPHLSHYNLQESLAIIATLTPTHAYLVHISHQMGLHREVDATLPDNTSLAYDGLKVCL